MQFLSSKILSDILPLIYDEGKGGGFELEMQWVEEDSNHKVIHY